MHAFVAVLGSVESRRKPHAQRVYNPRFAARMVRRGRQALASALGCAQGAGRVQTGSWVLGGYHARRVWAYLA